MRRSLVAIGLVLAACGGTPSAPSSTPDPPDPPDPPAQPAVAQFAGLWSGPYKLASCSGDRHCVLYIGTSRTFELRLQQSGGHVEGLFVTSASAADVSGDVEKDGHLTLRGIDHPMTNQDWSMSAQVELQLAADGALSGTLLHETTSPPEYAEFYGPVRITGDVVSARHGDLTSFATVIDGTWSGRFAVRSCSPVPPDPYCYPFRDQEMNSVQFTLQRGGSALAGTMTIGSDRIPVSGAITGSSFTMSGETISPASGGNARVRVSGFTGSIDAFGRMTGTLLYESAYPVAAPKIGESAQLELRQVLKQL